MHANRLSLKSAALFYDITSNKKAEEALRQSEQRERERAAQMAVVFETIPTPVIIVHDRESRHMAGNRAANELVRLPARRRDFDVGAK